MCEIIIKFVYIPCNYFAGDAVACLDDAALDADFEHLRRTYFENAVAVLVLSPLLDLLH